MSLLVQELVNYYNNKDISKLIISYSDYAIDLHEKKRNNYYDSQIEFYRKMLIDEESYELLNLPKKIESTHDITKEINNKISSSAHKTLSKSIDNTICQSIHEYLKKNEISKTAFFISIYRYILSKFSHQDIIYTSIIGSNRNSYYKENMFGMFVNIIKI